MTKNSAQYAFFLFYLLIINNINISNTDFTTNIDFDLTVIFNSIQIYSGQFQDYRDHPAFTQFLIFGFFYKILSLISFFKIDIYNFENVHNLYDKINYVYYLFRNINSLIIFLSVIFFNKILNFFFLDKITSFILSFCILVSSSTFFNIFMLRADIFAFLFFLISFYYLLSLIKKPKIFKVIIISLTTILAMLSKIQIIIFYFWLLILIPFFFKYEIKNFNLNNDIINEKFSKTFNSNIFITILILLFIIFHLIINNLPNSRFADKKYLDLILFSTIFFSYYVYLKLFFQKIFIRVLNTYILILIYLFLTLLFLNFLSLINLIKLSPYVNLRISNPFYYLSVYGPNFYLSIYDQVIWVIKNFTFKINYIFFIIVLILNIFSFIYEKNYKYKLYSLLFLIFFLATNFFYNFRYHETYGFSLLFLLFFSLYFSLHCISVKKLKYFTLFLFFIFFFANNHKDINNKAFVKKSNLMQICSDNQIKNFYWWWARGLDDNFFKKICEENKLPYKKFIKIIS